MTIQPTFRFARHRQVVEAEDADQPVDPTPSDGEKGASTAADRTPSLSSVVSDEKQTFGVSKVEAVTTVWTKASLITLYVLSVAAIRLLLIAQYFPRLFRQFDAATDYRPIFAVRHECICVALAYSGHRNCLQYYNRCNEASACEDS